MYFNTIETLKHVFIKKTFANTAVVLQVSTIISFYQLRPAYQLCPTSRYLSVKKLENTDSKLSLTPALCSL